MEKYNLRYDLLFFIFLTEKEKKEVQYWILNGDLGLKVISNLMLNSASVSEIYHLFNKTDKCLSYFNSAKESIERDIIKMHCKARIKISKIRNNLGLNLPKINLKMI